MNSLVKLNYRISLLRFKLVVEIMKKAVVFDNSGTLIERFRVIKDVLNGNIFIKCNDACSRCSGNGNDKCLSGDTSDDKNDYGNK